MPQADHCRADGSHKPTLPLAVEPDGVSLDVVGDTVRLRVSGGERFLSEAEARWLWASAAAVWSRLNVR